MRTPWRFLADLVSKRPAEAKVQYIETRAIEKMAPVDEIATTMEHWSASAASSRGEELNADQQVAVELSETTTQIEMDASRPLDPDTTENTSPGGATRPDSVIDEAVSVGGNVTPSDTLASLQDDAATVNAKPRRGDGTASNSKRVEQQKKTEAISATRGEISASQLEVDFEDMRGLEAEIIVLRLKLSHKLRAQNEQLKKLLRRYED